VFALSIHADYRCRHSGQCCSADWDVPIELPVYRSLTAAVDAGRLRLAPGVGRLEPFVVDPALPDGAAAVLERTEAGACVFLHEPSRLCLVHRDLGESALPSTCRHFPRLAVRDGRGTFVTLSHFCPTAAGLLFRDDVALGIVSDPPAFPPADYDGLSVTGDDLPPLLHPTVLMDLEGYGAWERHMVARCAEVERDPDSVLATLMRDARRLRDWRPGDHTLSEAVALFPRAYAGGAPVETLEASLALHAEAMGAVPPELLPEPDERGLDEAFARFVRPAWHGLHAPINRYVAAKSFASWTAYQGRGVVSIVRGLEAALALVRVEAARACRNTQRALDAARLLEAFRAADFILNHLAVGEDLASTWSAVEEA
jgi:Fe-S-cluster containining protein